MFYDILDEKRLAMLPLLKNFKDDYYLAGGTGLALQLGHRDSVDFDFFSQKDIDNEKMPGPDINLVLKSLVYFKDVSAEPIKFKNNNDVSLETVKKFLVEKVNDLNKK